MATVELCSDSVGDDELYDSPRKRKDSGSPKVPYYLRNFLTILNHVLQSAHNFRLFSEEELSLLRSFSELQEVSQQLYVRLFLRNHRWFKASKLSYPQITNDLEPVLDDLIHTQFLLNESQLEELPDVLDHLQLSELKQLCKDLKLAAPSKQSVTKASLTRLLLKHARQHRPLFATAPSSSVALLKKAKCVLGRCVKVGPSPRHVFQKCVLLFSLESTLVNEEDEQSEGQQLVFRMLEADVGRTVFPDYDIIVTKSLFSSAEEFTQYCAAYDCKQNMLSAIEGGRMGEVVSIAQECIGALSASVGEEEEILCKREKLDTLLGRMCHRAHSMQSPLPARTVSAPPSIQDEVIVLSDSDDDYNHTQGDEAKSTVDLSKHSWPTPEVRSERVRKDVPEPSSTGSANTRQVTLFDCCTAVPQTQVAERCQKEKHSLGPDEQDKSYTGAKASLKSDRDAKLSLSLRHKQLKQVEHKQTKPSPATTNLIKRSSTVPLQRDEGDSGGELSSEDSRPKRRLQPMRAAKRLKLTIKEEDGEDDEEDISYSVCSDQPSKIEPKPIKSSPVIDVRGSITRSRKISFSSLFEDDNDGEDLEGSPNYSSPLHKQPRRGVSNKDNEDDEDFEASPKYSSPIRKQPRRAVKRLNFGADSRNEVEEDGESLHNSLSTDVIELDSCAPSGSKRRCFTISLEHAANLKGDGKEIPQPHLDISAGRDGGRNSACRRTDSPKPSASVAKVALQPFVEKDEPLPPSRQSVSMESQTATDTVPPITSRSQCYSSGPQSSTGALIEAESPADSFQQLLAGEVHVRVLSHTVEYFEKQRRYREACALLQFLLAQSKHGRSSRGHWFDRLALNLDFHLKRQNEAFNTILQGLSDPSLHPGRKHSLHHRAVRICRSQKWADKLEQLPNMEVQPFPEKEILASNHPHKHHESYALFVLPSSPSHDDYRMVSVEQLALEHYRVEEGWSKGVHAEGSTFSTLFGLLFWDIIFFHCVPDVFRSRYQGLPLDFHSPAFYNNRRSAVDERLKWLASATTEEVSCLVEERWRRFEGQQCNIVTWALLSSADEAKSLTSCIGSDVLVRVFTLFTRQPYAHYRSGLPDLTLWNPKTRRSKFVEVKGPNDRLSSKQVLWLSRLVQWGCEAEVCKVKVKR